MVEDRLTMGMRVRLEALSQARTTIAMCGMPEEFAGEAANRERYVFQLAERIEAWLWEARYAGAQH